MLNCFFEGGSGQKHLADIWLNAWESDFVLSRKPWARSALYRPFSRNEPESKPCFRGNKANPVIGLDEVPKHSAFLHMCLNPIEDVSSPGSAGKCSSLYEFSWASPFSACTVNSIWPTDLLMACTNTHSPLYPCSNEHTEMHTFTRHACSRARIPDIAFIWLILHPVVYMHCQHSVPIQEVVRWGEKKQWCGGQVGGWHCKSTKVCLQSLYQGRLMRRINLNFRRLKLLWSGN